MVVGTGRELNAAAGERMRIPDRESGSKRGGGDGRGGREREAAGKPAGAVAVVEVVSGESDAGKE